MMRRRSLKSRERAARVIHRAPVEPGSPLRVGAIMTICTEKLAHEIDSWMATAAVHHPKAKLYVVGDYPACDHAYGRAVQWNLTHRFVRLPLLAGDGLRQARERCRRVATIHSYWKEDIIWWKIEGLRRVLSEFEANGDGVLLTDSDITFTGAVAEEFPHADVVLSPFHWAIFDHRVRHPRDGVMPLPQRDGFFNAGYLLTRRPEVAEAWLDLYERGVGGFYEQKCLEELPRRFACDYFGVAHNWGKWRREAPRPGTVSIHYHAREVVPDRAAEWLKATKRAAEDASAAAIESLTR